MTEPKQVAKKEPKAKACNTKSKPLDLKEMVRQNSTRSHLRAGILHESFAGNMLEGVNMLDVAEELKNSFDLLESGDCGDIDFMYLSQAKSLEWLFVSLARRASFAEQLPQYQAFMSLALKAQAQSRATLQALVDRRNPKQVAFVKQANIAGGHQQVNNAQAESEKTLNAPSKLLTENSDGGESLDFGATKAAGPDYQSVEALGKIYGREN